MLLLHGTARKRAELIVQGGPDPQFREPGGQPGEAGFSLCVASGPFPFGRPVEYAHGKANQFPNESGPVILIVDVPDDIVANAVNE